VRPLLTIILLLFCASLIAQPETIQVTGCTNSPLPTDYNDIYNLSSNSTCYIAANNPMLILQLTGGQWQFGVYINPTAISCVDVPFTMTPLSDDGPSDITLATLATGGSTGNCDSVVKVEAVPTLGQWGIISLALLLLSISIISLKRTQFKSLTYKI